MTIWSMLDFGDKPKPLPLAPIYGEKLETLPLSPADEPPRRKGGWPKGRPRKVAE